MRSSSSSSSSTHLAERRAEHRDEHLARVVGGVPVDVEPVGVRRLAAVAQQRPPRGVLRLRLADGHVVRHDVEHDPEAVLAAGRDHRVEVGLRAELGVEPAVVDDVVAVRRAGRGLQVRRAVQVRHAEVGQVRHDRRRVGEAEARVVVSRRPQLDAVGRHRDGPSRCGQMQPPRRPSAGPAPSARRPAPARRSWPSAPRRRRASARPCRSRPPSAHRRRGRAGRTPCGS